MGAWPKSSFPSPGPGVAEPLRALMAEVERGGHLAIARAPHHPDGGGARTGHCGRHPWNHHPSLPPYPPKRTTVGLRSRNSSSQCRAAGKLLA